MFAKTGVLCAVAVGVLLVCLTPTAFGQGQDGQKAASSVPLPPAENLRKLAVAARAYLQEGLVSSPTEYYALSGDAFAARRTKLATSLLKGLRLLLDNGVPAEAPPFPTGGAYHFNGAGAPPELVAQWRAEEAEMMAQHESVLAMIELLCLRGTMAGDISAYYTDQPDGTAELRQLASQFLRDDTVLAEILARRDAALAARARLAAQRAKQTPGDK